MCACARARTCACVCVRVRAYAHVRARMQALTGAWLTVPVEAPSAPEVQAILLELFPQLVAVIPFCINTYYGFLVTQRFTL